MLVQQTNSFISFKHKTDWTTMSFGWESWDSMSRIIFTQNSHFLTLMTLIPVEARHESYFLECFSPRLEVWTAGRVVDVESRWVSGECFTPDWSIWVDVGTEPIASGGTERCLGMGYDALINTEPEVLCEAKSPSVTKSVGEIWWDIPAARP